MNLNLLKTFVKLAEFGNFTKTAEHLNQPKSRVSRSISKLEEELGIQLVRRTTRQTSLTSAGSDYYQRIALLISQIDEETKAISDSSQALSGLLRITAPEDMAQTIVSRLVSQFSEKHPKIKIECIVTNQFLDLTKENIDLAFRAGKLTDSNLIQRKLHQVELITIASKAYLQKYGTPQLENELSKHRVMSFKGMSSYKNSFITTDSFAMLLNMTLLGNGIAIVPDFICKGYLDSGELIKLFPLKKNQSSSVHIVYPPSRNIPLKTKKFIKLATSISW